MENNTFNKKDSQSSRFIAHSSGITLVALIITIIVLLILAVVVIRAVTGNGIIAHAQNAREQFDISAEKEKILLGILMSQLNNNIDEKSAIEKEINMKIIETTAEDALGGKIIELENRRKYLITKDKNVEYVENIENAVLRETYKNEEFIPLLNGTNYESDAIERIRIVNHKNIPDNAYSWDVSESNDKSVMAWITDDDNNGMYELNIGGYCRIKANKNSTALFGGYTNCVAIEGLNFLDTSNTTNMFNMFINCNSLKELQGIENWNTKKVTNMIAMFCNCYNLKQITLTTWDTSSVMKMGEMFYYCKNLTDITLDFNTANVTEMYRMFAFCDKLKNVNLQFSDTQKLQRMESMFTRDYSLEELNLKNFSTENVTTMHDIFFSCDNLRKLDISNFTLKDGINMVNSFGNLSRIEVIYVKDNSVKEKIVVLYPGLADKIQY